MTDRLWHTRAVPLRTSTPLFLNLANEEVKRGRDLIRNTPWSSPDFETSLDKSAIELATLVSQTQPGSPDVFEPLEGVLEHSFNERHKNPWDYLNRDMANEAMLFTDPNAPGEWVRGMFSAWDAAAESMQQDYHRGWTSRNMPHEVWAGKAMLAGRDTDALKGTILEFDEEAENFARDRMYSSKWNTKFWEDGRFPIVNLAMETPEDLLLLPPPEGWDPKDALEFFREKDPDAYKRYSLALGGHEELERLTKDSRNQYEFFYRLGEQLTLNTVNKSLEVTQRNWDGFDHTGHFLGTLGVHGILNDPDMVASMALSIGLAIPTGGLSVIAGLGSAAIKSALIVKRGVRLANLSKRGIKLAGHGAQISRRLQNWLPENVGPHLLQQYLWNGRRFTKYNELTRMKKFGVYTLGNMLEGGITGSMAEMANQYQKTSRGVTENWDWGVVGMGTLHEIGLSILINPVMGRAFQGLGWASSLPGYAGARLLKPTGLGKYLNNLVDSVKGSMHPESITRNLDVIESVTNLQKGLDMMGMPDIGRRIGTIMNILATNSGLDEVGIANVLNDSVSVLLKSENIKNPEMSLLDAVVNHEAFVGHDNAFKAALKGKLELANEISKRADAESIPIGEFLKNNKNSPEILLGIDLLPGGQLEALHDRAGGEPKWNQLASDAKIEHIAEFLNLKQEEAAKQDEETKKAVKKLGEDAGVNTDALNDAPNVTEGVMQIAQTATEQLQAAKAEQEKIQKAMDALEGKKGATQKRNIKIREKKEVGENIDRLAGFIASLNEAKEIGQAGHLPPELMQNLNTLRAEEKHVNSLLQKLENNPTFNTREEWKGVVAAFNEKFGSFDIEGTKIPLDEFNEQHVDLLNEIISKLKNPGDKRFFIEVRDKLEKATLGSLDIEHLNERFEEVSKELEETLSAQEALQEVFEQQTDITAMLESPDMEATMIEDQAEADAWVANEEAGVVQNPMDLSDEAAALLPTSGAINRWQSFRNSLIGGRNPDAEELPGILKAFRVGILRAFKRPAGPKRAKALEEVLEDKKWLDFSGIAEGRFTTDDFNTWAKAERKRLKGWEEKTGRPADDYYEGTDAGWKKEWEKWSARGEMVAKARAEAESIRAEVRSRRAAEEGQEAPKPDPVDKPTMVDVDGVEFDANFTAEQIAMMRTLPSLQTVPNKKRKINRVVTGEAEAGPTVDPTDVRGEIFISGTLLESGKENELASAFGRAVGRIQFHKLTIKQKNTFKKLTEGWIGPAAQIEIRREAFSQDDQNRIDQENFADIWLEVLDAPQMGVGIFTIAPLDTKAEADIRAFIQKEFQDKAEANGPNRFRDRPPTRRGTILIPTMEDLANFADFVQRLQTKIETLDKYIAMPKHPGGVDTEDLKRESINISNLDHLHNKLFDIYTHWDEKWKGSGLGGALAADGKKLEQMRIDFEVKKNEHFRESLKKRDTWFTKLHSVRMLLENKKFQRNSLNTRQDAYASLIAESIKNGTPLTRNELSKRLPLDSKMRTSWLAKTEKKESFGEGVVSAANAKSIGQREFTKARGAINRLRIEDLDTSRVVYPPTPRMYNTSPLLNETTDEDLLLVPIDADYLTAERISDEDIAKIQDTEKELEAWISMTMQLKAIEGSEHVDIIGKVQAARIYAAMIEGGNDYFYKIGMKPHEVFEKAIYSPEIMESMEARNDLVPGNPIPDGWINAEAANFRYDIGQVIQIAEDRADFIRAKMENWIGKSWQQTLDSYLKDFTTEGRRKSLSDHYKAVNLLEAMESMQSTAMKDLYTNVYRGYAVSLDDTTGRPDNVTEDLSFYKAKVKESAITRLRDAIRNGEFDNARLSTINERFGLVEGDALWQYFNISESAEEMSKNATFAIDLLLNNYLTTLREDFTIEKFGNGDLDYRDATTLGEELVDIAFRDRPYPGRNSLEAREGVSSKSSELSREDMESMLVRRPHYGEGTAYAPMPLWRFAAMVGEYKFRSRAQHILNTELTPEKLKAAAEFRKTLTEHADPDRVGVGLPVSVRPRLVGATLSSQIISRGKLKDFLLELFLDMPNIAHSFISDQETVSKDTKYFQFGKGINAFPIVPRERGEGTQTMIGSGENLKVPFGQMGNIAAIELMNPDLEGLGKSIMDLVEEDVRKVKTEWEANNPGKPFDLGSMFEAVTTTDQQFSGRYVGKLLALGGDPNGRAKIKQFLTDIENKPEVWGLKSEEDFYVVSGLLMNAEMFKPSNIDTVAVTDLGRFREIFASVKDIKNLDEWNTYIAGLEPESKELQRAKALREYWKVPTMRRDYDGGIGAFMDDFMPGGKRNEWTKVMVPLQESFDIETPFTREEVEALGRLTFKAGTLRNEALIDYALMMTGPEKAMALDYLALDSSFEFEGGFWRDNVIKSMVPDPSTHTVMDNSTILSLDNHRKALKETITDWTYKTYGRIDDALVAKTEKKYANILKEAKKYLKRLEADSKPLNVNTPEWETYQLILHGQIDGEGNEIAGSEGLSYSDIGFFRALNMYNSSAYKLDMPHMDNVSRALGFQEFSAKDWLGLENHLLYQLFLPTQRSHRTSPVFNSMDPMGIKLERVASEKQNYTDFMAEAMAQIKDPTALDFALKSGEYISRNNSNPFGMFDLVDNPYKKMSRAKAVLRVEQIMTMHEMLYFAQEDKLPKEVYPEYIAEDNPNAILANTLNQWKENSVEMEEMIPDIIKFEEDLYNAGPYGKEILKLKGKAGVIYSPSIAQKLEAPQTNFYHREGKQGELFADTVQSHAGIQTSRPKGPLAMMPLTKRHSIMDKGNIALQQIALQRQIDLKRHWINKRLDQQLVDENPLLQGKEIGGRSPFKPGTLPRMLDVPVDVLSVLPDNEVGRRAAEIYGKVNSWITNRGIDPSILKDPEMWPYLLNVIETEEVQTTLVAQMNRQSKRVHANSRKRSTVESWRQRWLSSLFEITNVSFDVKNSTRRGASLEEKSMEVGISNVEGLLAETWYNILLRNRKRGKKASEDNREGYLNTDTLLQKSLSYGVIPGAAGMLIRDKRGNKSDDFDFSGTQLRASAIQAHDFMKFLVKLLWNDGIYQVIKTDPMYKKFFKADMTPDDWTVLPDAMKEDLYGKAVEKLKGHKGFTFEAKVTEKGLDLYRYSGAKPDMPRTKAGEKTLDFNQRNALAEAGIGFMTATPKTLKGQTVELVITPELAMQMLSYLENFRLTERVEMAAHMRVPFGTKLGELGQRVRARSDEQIIRDALAPNESEVRETSMIETDAIKTIVDTLENKDKLVTVNTGIRKTTSRGTMEFLDRDYYRYPRAKEIEGMPRFVNDYLEAYISPISKLIANIDWNQTQAFDAELRNDLTTLIKSTRTASSDQDISTMIQLSLFLKESSLKPDVARAFLDPERFSESQQTIGYQRASKLHDRIQSFRNTSILGQAGSVLTSPGGREIANLMREFLGQITARESTDRNTIFSNLKFYIATAYKSQTIAEARAKNESIRDISDTDIEILYDYALGEELSFDEASEFRSIEGDVSDVVSDDLAEDFGDGNQIGFDFNTGGREIKSLSKTHNNFHEWAKGTRNNYVILMGQELNEAVNNKKINITNKEAQVMRAILIRQYQRNPLLLDDVALKFSLTEDSSFSAMGRSSTIVIGKEGTTVMGQRGTRLTAAKIFAHELAHVGATKFLEGAPWITWTRMYNNRVGRQYLKKMVQSWHGGRFDADAKKEYKRYLSSPDEFIAGLVSYKLFHATLPDVDFNSAEMDLHAQATNFVKKILDWFKGHWDRLSSVFVNFRQSHPELSKEIDTITLNTMGYDPLAGPLVRLDNESTKASHGFMTYDTRFENMKDNFEMSNNELLDLITEFDGLIALQDTASLNEAQMSRYVELEEILVSGEGAKPHGVTGISRWHYLRTKQHLVKNFGHKDGRSVDLFKILNTENPDGVHADPLFKATAVEAALEAMDNVYGAPFRGNAGSVAASLANKLVGKRSGKLSHNTHDLLTGQAGSNLTWNGWHPLMISMSAMIDDRVATMVGQYANSEGLPSVTKALEEIHSVSTALKVQREKMTDEISGLAYKLSGRNHFLGEDNTKMLSSLDAQIMMKIDNPTHEFNFEGIEGFDSLEAKSKANITEAMDDSVLALKSYLHQLVEDGRDDGSFGKGFTAVVPYRLNNQIKIEDTRLNFKTELGKTISERILKELSDTENSNGRIDPLLFMGARALPRIDGTENLRNDLMRIRDTDVNLYNWLMKEFAAPIDIDKTSTERTSQIGLRQGLEDKLQLPREGETLADFDGDIDTHTLNMVKDQWSKILKGLARGKINWGLLKGAGVDVASLKTKYESTLTDESFGTREYLLSLRMDATKAYVPDFIFHNTKDSSPRFNSLLNDTQFTPIDIHIHNLLNRASVGLYFPNDIWTMPKVSEVISNPKLKDLFVWNPTQITEEFRKGLGDEIHERKMMREKFGIHGTFGQFAKLVRDVIANPPDGPLRAADGRDLSRPESVELDLSAKVLVSKWEMTKGIIRRDTSGSNLLNTVADIAPALTRVIFGGNLSLASAIVEGGINIVSEGIGRTNFTGTIRSILAPILNIPIVNKDLRRRVGADIAYHVETLTQSYIPDYEKPANEEADKWYVTALKVGGKQQLRPAQWIMASIASQRAVSARLFITDNIDKITDLARSIAEKPLDMTNPNDLKGRMREVKFKMTAVLEQDLSLVRYMLNAGLLDSSTFLEMKRMIQDFSKANPGDRHYIINEMHLQQLAKDPANLDYRKKMDVITGLRYVEKEFIHEVILEPKAFDIFTGNVSKGGEGASISPLESIFEVYRRHPILFVSQHLFRNMNSKHPLKWGFGLISLIMLDIVYMLSLRMANGEDPEDLLDDLDNNRLTNFMQYMSRLPILGRWGSEIGGMINGLAMMTGQDRAGSFISFSALQTQLAQIIKASKGWINDGDYKVQDTINAFKGVPIVGNAVIRTGLYTGLGMLGDPYNPNRRTKSGSGGGGGGGSSSANFAGNYGVNAFDMPMTHEGHLRQLMSELTQHAPIPTSRMSAEVQNFSPPWASGRTPFNTSRNEIRDTIRKQADDESREVKQKQYEADAAQTRKGAHGYPTTGDIDFEAIEQQKGTSGDLADKLLGEE